jgi:hypothetical protein
VSMCAIAVWQLRPALNPSLLDWNDGSNSCSRACRTALDHRAIDHARVLQSTLPVGPALEIHRAFRY